MTRRVILLLIAWAFALAPSHSAYADEIRYFYDDAGRLTRAVSGTDAAVYQYDEVGNLLSITRGVISPNPPVLSSITPDVLFVDSTIYVVIAGKNLLTTTSITSDNASLTSKTLSVTDTEIRLVITTSADALTGGTNVAVSTSFGSANIGITKTKLTFSPNYLVLALGANGSVSATISPIVGKDISITLSTGDATIATTPPVVIIPAAGTATFNVSALQEGTSVISSYGITMTNVSIFVTQPFVLLPGESVTPTAKPVSVYIMPSTAVNVTPASLPVSVYIKPSPFIDVTPVSLPVSVFIQPSTAVDVITVSQPVSTQISPP
jgi:YD repeat-containing protein